MNRNHVHYFIQFSLLLLLLLGILLQGLTHFFELKPLNGVTNPTTKVDLSQKTYFDGSYQHYLEQYAKQHTGFRECLIRLYNQYLWDCFKQTQVESIVVGKDDYIYNKDHVNDYMGTYWQGFADSREQLYDRLQAEAVRIYKVQEILASYGKHLFVVIEPGKANVYPEHLPKQVKKPLGNVTAADIYPILFDSLGVNYIDFNKLFQEAKDTVPYQLFPRSGTHWSNIAALHAADSILRYMAWLGNCALPTLAIDASLYDTVMQPDNDLEELLNLARPLRGASYQYAPFKVVTDTDAYRPTLLTVGDSYFWNISYHIPLDSIFSRHPFWYYNSTVFYDPDNHSTYDLNYTQQLINTDYVMVSYSTANLYSMSNYFSSKALVNLCYDKTEVNRAIDQIVNEIDNNPEWTALIQQKADAEGTSLEIKKLKEAEYFLYANAEKYFPTLNDSLPAQRNQMLGLCQPDNPMGDILRNMLNDPIWMNHLRQKAQEKQLDLETVMVEDAQWMLKASAGRAAPQND